MIFNLWRSDEETAMKECVSLQSVADREVFLPNDEIWLYDLQSGLLWVCVCVRACVWERESVCVWQNLILPSATCSWKNIVINQSDLKNKFIIFVKCRLTMLVQQCHSSMISYDFRDYSWLGLGVGKWSRLHFWIKMLFQGQQYMLTQGHI